VASFNAYQRDWFAGIRQQVAEGSPFAMVNANAPQEILRALDIPFVVNQWWASIVAAKQQSRRYQGLLRAHHYPSDVEAYSAQGLAAHFDEDADNAPWGGLPHPDFLHAVASSEPTAKIFANWGQESGAQTFVYEKTSDPRPDLYSDWWQRLPDQWDTALEEERIDLMTEELRAVIASLEQATGRRFDAQKFRAVMDLVNEQEGYYRATRDLVARTVPAPIGVVDSMPATMVPQWHRGTVWARDAARAFHEEVKARVDAGLAACAHEKSACSGWGADCGAIWASTRNGRRAMARSSSGRCIWRWRRTAISAICRAGAILCARWPRAASPWAMSCACRHGLAHGMCMRLTPTQ
jgi:hypothetical protein